MRRSLVLVLALVMVGCGDDTNGAAGSGGSGGTGGSGGSIDAPMVDAPAVDAAADRPMLADANISDAGTNTTPVTPNRVSCPLATGGMCDTTTSVCCGSFNLDAGTATEMCVTGTCTEIINLACDGKEDCPGNQFCCIGTGAAGRFHTQCLATCNQNQRAVCHDHTQCPANESSCCYRSTGGGNATTGTCFAPGTEPAGSACDTP